MSVDGISNTFYPITLSGLTLTDSLNTTYVPYSGASLPINVNNQDITNIKTLSATTINASGSASIGTSYSLYAYNVSTIVPTSAYIILNGANQTPFNVGDVITIIGASIPAINGNYTVQVNYAGVQFLVTNNAGLGGGNYYPTGGIVYVSGTGALSSISATTITSTVSGNETVGGTLSVTGNETVGGTLTSTGLITANAGISVGNGTNNMTITGTSTLTTIQYLANQLVINNPSGTNYLLFTTNNGIICYTKLVVQGDFLLTGVTNAFVYTDGTGKAIAVQGIFAVGTTPSCSPNILLAGGGAFQVSNTANTQSYLAVQSTGVSSTLPIYGTGVVATGNPTYAAGTTAMWMSVESSATGVLGAGLYGTNYYPISYRGKTHQLQCDGVEKMTQSATNWNVVNCIANIYSGTRLAVPSGYMANGTLTLGSIGFSFGGGSSWTSNTAGLMLETSLNQEIMVHHSTVRVTSLMYYSGTNQQIYIGRNCGFGTANTVNVAGNLVCGSSVTVSAGDNSKTLYGPSSSYSAYLLVGAGGGGAETSSNTACMKVTNGNLHLDCATSGSYALYLNYYSQGSNINMYGIMTNTYSNNQFGGSCTNNQPVCASFRQNSIGNWIGSRHDSTYAGSTPDCIVIGSLSNQAWIGAHNYNLTAWATMYLANGVITPISDERLKDNIITANNELCYNNIKKVRLVRYNYKEDGIAADLGKDDKNRLGVIAQELREIYPRSVIERDDPTTNTSFLSINTDQLYYSLLGCTQELQNKVEQQQDQIKEQQKQIDELKELVNALIKK